MVIAVGVITIGSDKIGKATTDQQKYKTMAIWFGIGLLLILISIPWSFSPFTSRPNFRPF
jgi:cytochrome bd-type quinol oxidase subunit 2